MSITRMIVDIFPIIDIPVVLVAWNYRGLSAEDMERRVVLVSRARLLADRQRHRAHREHSRSPASGCIKVFFQPGHRHRRRHRADQRASTTPRCASCRRACSRPTSSSSTPPTCGVVQLTSSSKTMSEQEIVDYTPELHPPPAVHHPRHHRSTGSFGGKQRQIIVDIDPCALAAKGVSPNDVVAALQTSNVIVPAGVARIGDARIQRADELQPAGGDAVHAAAAGGAQRRAGARSATSPQSATASPPRPTSSTSTASAPPTWRCCKPRRRLHARGGGRHPRPDAGDQGRRAARARPVARLRPVGVRPRGRSPTWCARR